ncbi:hypothetical protein F0562_015730 [Nyssa sinensis]|uniref:Phytocyanin domain-containing protein n=1 Tax=Nyssa sinensis TaxID=561372 RepID=A0A5J4ZMD8_9ASTE|nr:hypothetical protein F0562_015730 [Nyssa sinensis]
MDGRQSLITKVGPRTRTLGLETLLYPAGVHTVFKVNENGYKYCIVPSNNDALTSGKDTVTLDKPGKQYFLCGVGMHCEKAGQKLQVDVKDGSSGNTEEAAAAAPTTTDYIFTRIMFLDVCKHHRLYDATHIL